MKRNNTTISSVAKWYAIVSSDSQHTTLQNKFPELLNNDTELMEACIALQSASNELRLLIENRFKESRSSL